MKLYHLAILLFLTSCATKYIVPGNRFITPETQGDAFRGSIEIQQNQSSHLKIDTSDRKVDNGVIYDPVTRTGFMASNSIFDQFDILWTHTGGSNSLIGGKFQFLGESRVAKAAGHKGSLAILFGGNEHESDDENFEFELTGREYLLLYGYRINETILPYMSLSLANYSFNGKITSGSLKGLEPEYATNSKALNTGFEFSFDAFFAKLEATYQQLETDDTKKKERFVFGYSLGLSW